MYPRTKFLSEVILFMEMTLLDEGKLKICLTPLDMVKYDLTCEKIDYDNTETRRALWEMFDEAKHRTGFDAASGKICIRVYPEKSGGCEIYITKLNIPSLPEKSMIDTKDTSALCSAVKSTYVFDSLDMLLFACRALAGCETVPQSSAYYYETGGKTLYYLSFVTPSSKNPPRETLFMGELGRKCRGDICRPFLFEHASVICENNAAEILSKLC